MPLRRSCLQCDTKGPNCFCSLDRTALERLESVGHWLRLEAHQEVLREGYAPDHVYVICSGTLKLTTSSMDGRLLLLRIVGPGDVLGLSAALRRSRYEATAETLEICQLKAIPRTHFLLFMEEFQAVGRNSLMAVTRDYQSATLSARRLALSTSAAAKLGSVLLEWGGLVLAGQHELMGGSVPNSIRFHMPLTHEELGHMAGISRETVTRTLTALRRDGLLLIENDQMQLRDIARLQQQVG